MGVKITRVTFDHKVQMPLPKCILPLQAQDLIQILADLDFDAEREFKWSEHKNDKVAKLAYASNARFYFDIKPYQYENFNLEFSPASRNQVFVSEDVEGWEDAVALFKGWGLALKQQLGAPLWWSSAVDEINTGARPSAGKLHDRLPDREFTDAEVEKAQRLLQEFVGLVNEEIESKIAVNNTLKRLLDVQIEVATEEALNKRVKRFFWVLAFSFAFVRQLIGLPAGIEDWENRVQSWCIELTTESLTLDDSDENGQAYIAGE